MVINLKNSAQVCSFTVGWSGAITPVSFPLLNIQPGVSHFTLQLRY